MTDENKARRYDYVISEIASVLQVGYQITMAVSVMHAT
jgi:hypothetical protein